MLHSRGDNNTHGPLTDAMDLSITYDGNTLYLYNAGALGR